MIRTMLLAVFAGAAVATAAGADDPHANAYTATTWEVAVRTLPCDAFRKNDDGSWSQTRQIVIGDGRGAVIDSGAFQHTGWGVSTASGVLINNSFKDTGETRVLELRCAK
jgi:hypothetical protein